MEKNDNILELKTILYDKIEKTHNINILKSIFQIIETQKQLEDESNGEIPDFHKKILDERLEDYLINPNATISWDEAQNEIEKIL